MADGIMYVRMYVRVCVCGWSSHTCITFCLSPYPHPQEIAIISEAASSGISLQADRRVKVGADCVCCMCHTRSVLGSIGRVLCRTGCVLCHAGCVLCHAGCVLCHAGCVLCYAGCVLCKWSGLHSYFVLLSCRTRRDGFISLLSCRGVLTRPSNSLVSGRKREERGREQLGKRCERSRKCKSELCDG